ncbi:MAG: hypothetical protein HQL56_18525 [Magnetococcales bacterium]|nr:hypothetical protein [Magnetococcales bacterium]
MADESYKGPRFTDSAGNMGWSPGRGARLRQEWLAQQQKESEKQQTKPSREPSRAGEKGEDKKAEPDHCRTGHRKDGSTYVWCDEEGQGRKKDPCGSVKDPHGKEACYNWQSLKETLQQEEEAYEEAQKRCPEAPPRGRAGWKPYVGDSTVFHCGFEGYLENHHPTPENPTAECFYDKQGTLVDDSHPYSWCQGTADQYPASDPRHVFPDLGGLVLKGFPAGLASFVYWRLRKR